VEDYGRDTAELHRREILMHPLHVATSYRQHLIRPNFHAVGVDDADRIAAWAAQALTYSGLHQVQGRADGGGVEGSG